MPTEQSPTPKEDRRITSIRDSERTMARNQYRYHRILTKIEWNRHNSGYCRPIYKDNQTKSNNNEHIIGRNRKNLQGQNLETIWNTQKNPKQQRTTICIEIHGGTHKGIGNEEITIDGIPSPNKWSNRKNQSRNKNVSMTLCELQTE